MKKILITGSSGLIGKAIIKELLFSTMDYEIYAASSKPAFYTDDKVHYISNDEIENVLKENTFYLLLQLAFPRNVKENQWAEGFKFVANMFYLAKKYSVERIVNVSSQSIYGWKRKTFAKETDNLILNSPYTTGKFFSEIIVNELFKDRPHTNVRLSTIIGPTTDERVPNKFIAQIIEGKDLVIKGGTQIFSFLDVRDAASGLVKLIVSNQKWRETYNLGTAEYATLLQIARMSVALGENQGFKSDIIVEPADIILNNMLDVSAMKVDFGWEARYTLRESLEYIFTESFSHTW